VSKLPTLLALVKIYKSLQKESGFTHEEAFEDIAGDLLFQLRSYKKAADSWMKDADRLKKENEQLQNRNTDLDRMITVYKKEVLEHGVAEAAFNAAREKRLVSSGRDGKRRNLRNWEYRYLIFDNYQASLKEKL
jgi:regulator of replication initiation timing